MIKFDGVTIIGWIFLQKATSPELSQASIFDSQVEGADDQLCVLLILRPGLLSSPRTATVGRRLSFRLGRCQGHRGKGWVTGSCQKQSSILFSLQTYRMSTLIPNPGHLSLIPYGRNLSKPLPRIRRSHVKELFFILLFNKNCKCCPCHSLFKTESQLLLRLLFSIF